MDATTNANTQPPFSLGEEPSAHAAVEPYVFVHDDLLHFALHTNDHAKPLWMPHDNDSYVAMMLEPSPLVPTIKDEPPHSPMRISAPVNTPGFPSTSTEKGNLRRSARIAATPHRAPAKQPTSPTAPARSMVGLTSSEDDDEGNCEDGGDDDSGNDARATVADKRERRRQQVRDASSRRRVKLKAEDAFLTKRVQELEAHIRILHTCFPQLVPPPPRTEPTEPHM
jgi:hypothetical protein